MTATLASAIKAHASAERALARMRDAKSFPDFEDAWNDLLSAHAKVWTRVIEACKANRTLTQKWRAHQEAFRKTDPLLRYLQHARNSDQHSVTDAIAHQPGSSSMIIGPPGSGPVHIKHLEIRGGRVVRYEGSHPLELRTTPPTVRLLAVTDRGQLYEPPTEHCGTPLASGDPFTVAKAGVAFNTGLLEELQKLIGS